MPPYLTSFAQHYLTTDIDQRFGLNKFTDSGLDNAIPPSKSLDSSETHGTTNQAIEPLPRLQNSGSRRFLKRIGNGATVQQTDENGVTKIPKSKSKIRQRFLGGIAAIGTNSGGNAGPPACCTVKAMQDVSGLEGGANGISGQQHSIFPSNAASQTTAGVLIPISIFATIACYIQDRAQAGKLDILELELFVLNAIRSFATVEDQDKIDAQIIALRNLHGKAEAEQWLAARFPACALVLMALGQVVSWLMPAGLTAAAITDAAQIGKLFIEIFRERPVRELIEMDRKRLLALQSDRLAKHQSLEKRRLQLLQTDDLMQRGLSETLSGVHNELKEARKELHEIDLEFEALDITADHYRGKAMRQTFSTIGWFFQCGGSVGLAVANFGFLGTLAIDPTGTTIAIATGVTALLTGLGINLKFNGQLTSNKYDPARMKADTSRTVLAAKTERRQNTTGETEEYIVGINPEYLKSRQEVVHALVAARRKRDVASEFHQDFWEQKTTREVFHYEVRRNLVRIENIASFGLAKKTVASHKLSNKKLAARMDIPDAPAAERRGSAIDGYLKKISRINRALDIHDHGDGEVNAEKNYAAVPITAGASRAKPALTHLIDSLVTAQITKGDVLKLAAKDLRENRIRLPDHPGYLSNPSIKKSGRPQWETTTRENWYKPTHWKPTLNKPVMESREVLEEKGVTDDAWKFSWQPRLIYSSTEARVAHRNKKADFMNRFKDLKKRDTLKTLSPRYNQIDNVMKVGAKRDSFDFDFPVLLRPAAIGDMDYEMEELAEAGICCLRDFEARNFLLALRKYYCEGVPDKKNERAPTEEEIESILVWLTRTTNRGLLNNLKNVADREISENVNHFVGFLEVDRRRANLSSPES